MFNKYFLVIKLTPNTWLKVKICANIIFYSSSEASWCNEYATKKTLTFFNVRFVSKKNLEKKIQLKKNHTVVFLHYFNSFNLKPLPAFKRNFISLCGINCCTRIPNRPRLGNPWLLTDYNSTLKCISLTRGRLGTLGTNTLSKATSAFFSVCMRPTGACLQW